MEIEVLYYSDQQVHIIVDKDYNHFYISYIYPIINVVKRRAFCEKLTYTFDTRDFYGNRSGIESGSGVKGDRMGGMSSIQIFKDLPWTMEMSCRLKKM